MLDKIIWIGEKIGIILLLGVVMLIGIDVAGRFLFNFPIKGSIEISQFVLVSLFSLGFVLVTIRKEHVTVDLFLERLRPLLQRRLLIITNLISVGLFLICASASFYVFVESFERHEATDVLGIPFYPFRLLFAASFIVTLAVVVAEIIRLINNKKE